MEQFQCIPATYVFENKENYFEVYSLISSSTSIVFASFQHLKLPINIKTLFKIPQIVLYLHESYISKFYFMNYLCANLVVAWLYKFQLIVAVEPDEIPRLENLYKRGQENQVRDLRMIGSEEIKEIEPNCVVRNITRGPEDPNCISGQKLHSSARNCEWNLERMSNSFQSTRTLGRVLWKRITQGSHIGQVHVFAGRVKIVSHLSCKTSATLKYFCPLCVHRSFTALTWCGPHSPVGNMSDCRSRGWEVDPGQVPYFCGDWSWNNFYGHSPTFRWFKKSCHKRKYVHKVLGNCWVKLA